MLARPAPTGPSLFLRLLVTALRFLSGVEAPAVAVPQFEPIAPDFIYRTGTAPTEIYAATCMAVTSSFVPPADFKTVNHDLTKFALGLPHVETIDNRAAAKGLCTGLAELARLFDQVTIDRFVREIIEKKHTPDSLSPSALGLMYFIIQVRIPIYTLYPKLDTDKNIHLVFRNGSRIDGVSAKELVHILHADMLKQPAKTIAMGFGSKDFAQALSEIKTGTSYKLTVPQHVMHLEKCDEQYILHDSNLPKGVNTFESPLLVYAWLLKIDYQAASPELSFLIESNSNDPQTSVMRIPETDSDIAYHSEAAADSGNLDLLKKLITAKEDNLDAAHAALPVAMTRGRLDAVKILLVHGAIANEGAVLYVAKMGFIKILDLVLEHTPKFQSRKTMTTLMLSATEYGHVNILQLLRNKYKAHHSWRSTLASSKDRTQPLVLASFRGMIDVVRYLLAEGADVNQAIPSGTTALIAAAQGGFADIVKLLLVSGANSTQAHPENDYYALHVAAQEGHLPIVMLLATKETIAHKGSNGMTPLAAAAYNGRAQVVDYLLEMGANPNEASAALPTLDPEIKCKLEAAFRKRYPGNPIVLQLQNGQTYTIRKSPSVGCATLGF